MTYFDFFCPEKSVKLIKYNSLEQLEQISLPFPDYHELVKEIFEPKEIN